MPLQPSRLHSLNMSDFSDRMLPPPVPLITERSPHAGEAHGSSGSTLEWVLRSLLRVREDDEARSTVVDLVRAASTARWAALYIQGDDGFLLSRWSPRSAEALGGPIPLSALGGILGGRRLPVLCDPASPLRRIVAPDLCVVAPLSLADGMQAIILLGPPLEGASYTAEDLDLIHRVVDGGSIALQNAQLLESLRSQVYVDFLTGCFNRRGFDARMRVEVGRARRYGRPMSLLLVDIDHFKWVNDSMGHPTGDYALRRMGEFLLDSFRTTDCVCRFGGDEFAIIFPETPKQEAARMGERLRVQVTALFPDEVLRRGLTVSLGIAAMPNDLEGEGDPEAELLRAADRALYRAKGSGRNRVILS